MVSPPFLHRQSTILTLFLGLPLTLSILEKTAGLYLVSSAAKWPASFVHIAICVVVFHLTAPNNPLRHLPQPPRPKCILGHVYSIIFGTPKGSTWLEWIDTVPNSGLIYYNLLPFGIGPSILLTSPEALQEALITRSYDFERTAGDTKLLEKFLGRGLIVVEGPEHKAQRKSVAPAFSGKQINDLVVPVFWAKSKELADVVAGQVHISPTEKDSGLHAGIVDISQWASHVTLDMIGLACVGRDFRSIYNAEDELCKTYEQILLPGESRGRAVVFEVVNIFLPIHISRRLPFFKRIRDAAHAKERLRVLCQELLVAKRRDMETESSKHIDILSVLIRSGQFTDDGLTDQLLTFLGVGHETTASAFTWLLYLLAIHPDVQARLRRELRSHFLNSDQDSAVSSLDALPYLNAVVTEQLRLLPSVPATGRSAARDTTLLGQPVPRGTIIITAPWAINRSKTHWGPDAEEFRPERWLEENASENRRSPMSMITFLHGPRSCIGQAFSKAELRCLVTAMVLRFEMAMADPSEVVESVALITIKPKNGMRLSLKELSLN